MALVRRRIQTRLLLLGLIVLNFSVLSFTLDKAHAHGVTNPWVHQRIAEKALDVWVDCPVEIKNHASNDVTVYLDWILPAKYNPENGDDIITGSGEEDRAWNNILWPNLFPPDDNEYRNGWMEHFWNPDVPNVDNYLGSNGYCGSNYTDGYNKGLVFNGAPYDSTYRLAQDLWDNKVIRLYKEGKQENNPDKIKEAYYWLGRVAHLLTDMTVPAHVHLLAHPDIPIVPPEWDDYFETYFDQESKILKYVNEPIKPEYRFESLPNLSDFDWSRVHSSPSNLFKLFWYTAQKTQYYASRSEGVLSLQDGNMTYQTINGDTDHFRVSLWNGDLWNNEAVTIIGNPADIPANLEKMADALIPHAMKAVAGLYRLFWIETRKVFSFPDAVNSARFSPDGTQILTGCRNDGVVTLWLSKTGERIRQFNNQGQVCEAFFSPDGRQIVVTTAFEEKINFYDKDSGLLLNTINNAAQVTGAKISSDRSKIVAGRGWSAGANLFNINTGEIIKQFPQPPGCSGAKFHPNDNLVLTFGGWSSPICLWNLEGALIREFQGGSPWVISADFSPDGNLMVTGTDAGGTSVNVWDVHTGNLIMSFETDLGHVPAVKFSPDGKKIGAATGNWQDPWVVGKAQLWDIKTKTLLATFEGHSAALTDIDFSPDGKQLLTSSFDGTAILWDISDLKIQPNQVSQAINILLLSD